MRLITLFVLIALTSCKTKTTQNDTSKETINFQIGFDYMASHSGVFYEQKTKQELVYFSNLVTGKQIKIFDLKGNLINEIVFDLEALKELSTPNGIQVISLDTILLNDYKKIIAVNSKGKLIYSLDLTDSLVDSLGNAYELILSTQALTATKNSLIYGLGPCPTNFYKDTTLNFQDFIKHYFKNVQPTTYHVVKIHNFFEPHFELEFLQQNFYKFINIDGYSVTTEFSNIHNEYLFSNFSDLIFKVDINYNKVDSFKVVSKYTPINLHAYNFVKDSAISMEEYYDKNLKYRGLIASVFLIKNILAYWFYMI